MDKADHFLWIVQTMVLANAVESGVAADASKGVQRRDLSERRVYRHGRSSASKSI